MAFNLELFCSRLLDSSISNNVEDARKEWIYIGDREVNGYTDSLRLFLKKNNIDRDDFEQNYPHTNNCICEHDIITNCLIYNTTKKIFLVVGSSCKKKFGIRKKCNICNKDFESKNGKYCGTCSKKKMNDGMYAGYTFKHVVNNDKNYTWMQLYGNKESEFSRYITEQRLFIDTNDIEQHPAVESGYYKGCSLYLLYCYMTYKNEEFSIIIDAIEKDDNYVGKIIELVKTKIQRKCKLCNQEFFLFRNNKFCSDSILTCELCDNKVIEIFPNKITLRIEYSVALKKYLNYCLGYRYVIDDDFSSYVNIYYKRVDMQRKDIASKIYPKCSEYYDFIKDNSLTISVDDITEIHKHLELLCKYCGKRFYSFRNECYCKMKIEYGPYEGSRYENIKDMNYCEAHLASGDNCFNKFLVKEIFKDKIINIDDCEPYGKYENCDKYFAFCEYNNLKDLDWRTTAGKHSIQQLINAKCEICNKHLYKTKENNICTKIDGCYILRFGKYKGKQLIEILDDKPYCQSLLDGDPSPKLIKDFLSKNGYSEDTLLVEKIILYQCCGLGFPLNIPSCFVTGCSNLKYTYIYCSLNSFIKYSNNNTDIKEFILEYNKEMKNSIEEDPYKYREFLHIMKIHVKNEFSIFMNKFANSKLVDGKHKDENLTYLQLCKKYPRYVRWLVDEYSGPNFKTIISIAEAMKFLKSKQT
jgi:hypothetical protein